MIHIENQTIHIHPAPRSSLPSFGAALLHALMEGGDESESGTTAPQGTTADRPAIGQYWPGQGGIYAGDFRDDDGRIYGLIVADCGAAKDVGRAKWGPGEHNLSQWDGQANTRILGDKYPAAKLAADYSADGHQDFYLPARRELQLAVATVPHLFGSESWYWSSTPSTESYAWAVDFEDGFTSYNRRINEFRVRPFRRFIY